MPEEFNIGKVADEIGADLFPSETSPIGGSDPTGETLATGQESGSPAPSLTPATPELSDIPFPKAWKKEKEPLWARLDRETREYIDAREKDVVRGFDMYSTGHKNWNELISPFEPIIKQHPHVNPVQVMQTLMKNHLALVQSDENQRVQLAVNLLKGYGIDPSKLAGLQSQAPAQNQLSPEVQRALNEVNQIKQTFTQFQEQQRQAQVAELEKQVEAFASDPKNKFFDEVADDIQRFLSSGAAQDLPSAYELACYANPAVRAKIIAEQAAPQTPPKNAPLNVSDTGEGTPRSKKPETIDDTINATVRRLYGTH